MTAPAQDRAAAPRARGPWLFAGVWLLFWALLALSGRDVFKVAEDGVQHYLLPAAPLEGVTRLRIEGDPGESQGYARATNVLIRTSSTVSLTVRTSIDGRRGRAGRTSHPLEGPAALPVAAVREGDTMILRWRPRVSTEGGPAPADEDVWISEIVLPQQFAHLVLSHALVEALDPVERLHVAGQSVEVRGHIAHLDLQSTLCGRCAGSSEADSFACDQQQRLARAAKLEVAARSMQSVRVAADAGQVELLATEGLRRLDLHLGDGVALSVDRAGVLRQAGGVQPAGACAEDRRRGTVPATAVPVERQRSDGASEVPGG